MKSMNITESTTNMMVEEGSMGYKKPRTSCGVKFYFAILMLLQLAIVAIVAAMIWQVLDLGTHVRKADNGQSGGQVGIPTTAVPPAADDVCMTPDCLRTAARLLEYMDPSIDPCDNFFEYSCGGWLKNTEIPPDAGRFGTFNQLRDDLTANMRDIIEDTTLEKGVEVVEKARTLYRSCMDEGLLDDMGSQPIDDLITHLNGWPVIDDSWTADNWDLLDTLTKLMRYSNSLLMSMYVTADDKDSSVYILAFDQADLGLSSRQYFLNPDLSNYRDGYLNYSIDIALLLRGDGDRATVVQQMTDMVDFETKLANITAPPAERRDPEALYHKMKLSNMSGYFEFPWVEYVNNAAYSLEETITEEEDILNYAPDFFTKLGPLLAETDNKTIANYIIWRMVQNRIGNLGSDFLKIREKFNRDIFGVEPSSRWETCVSLVNGMMGTVVSRLYLPKFFQEESKEKAVEMIDNIRVAFNELLVENYWMDDATRAVAEEKAEAMKQFIAYDDYIVNNLTRLTEDYEMLHFEETKYFHNILHNLEVSNNETFKYLRKPVEKDEWISHPTIVNAFYSPSRNSITFPAGILQGPFYDGTYPRYLNYGGIGAVIGHEITHGFDDSGRQFDKEGNLNLWWDPAVAEEFKKAAQCVMDQYSMYQFEEAGGLNLSGVITSGENIADNGGMKQTFRAYRSWVAANGPEPTLPGLDLNQEQLLFLNYGQIWCSKYRFQSAVSQVLNGPHSPGRFRVIGTLSNTPGFSEAYKCPVGSKMNPVKKCAVW
ncbi:MME [Branchiostoma lanceolatum]|uniref:MME protein n=1 Tax=Branchiostoma lanceolatum TaxID=7740 RepID=A0A8J9Z7C3_BRALA|nr:MME [Branchiostoma lanceolatum]